MSHEEAIAIKIYYNAIHSSYENEIELRYNSQDKITYYRDSKLTMKEHDYVFEYMYFGDVDRDKEELLKRKYISIIAEYLTKLDDVHTEKVRLR